MKTIRMPRRMGEVKQRLPKPQYDKPQFKRTNSQPALSANGVSEITSRQQNQVAQTGVKDARDAIRNLSQLNLPHKQVVDVESKSLIQKASEIRSHHRSEKKLPTSSAASQNSTPDKISISLADRAARINYELPKIDELADKENDTFA